MPMRNFSVAAGRVASVALLLGSALHAQTIVGTWQGTLPIPEKPRRIIKIARNDNGSLRGVMYRIDYDASSIPLTVSFQAPDLKIVQDILDNSFQGTLSADGKSITGTWTQDKQAYPMIFALTTPETLWKFAGAIPMAPMAATADPAFEVATIKPTPPDAQGWSYRLHTRQFKANNRSVEDLVELAWHVRSRQVDSAPAKAEWIDQLKFDIAAEPDTPGEPSLDQQRLMIRKLLADRFQFKFHTVQKIFPVYALTVERDFGKLTKSDPGVNNAGRIFTKEMPDGQMRLQFSYQTMPEFEDTLMNFIRDRQIVDETGLKGAFDFTFEVPMTLFQGDPISDDERTNIFLHAVQELGFKLVPKKESLDVIVIDHLEKPSAN
jgi:uncharacterized protein (TIGR03435 family)